MTWVSIQTCPWLCLECLRLELSLIAYNLYRIQMQFDEHQLSHIPSLMELNPFWKRLELSLIAYNLYRLQIQFEYHIFLVYLVRWNLTLSEKGAWGKFSLINCLSALSSCPTFALSHLSWNAKEITCIT